MIIFLIVMGCIMGYGAMAGYAWHACQPLCGKTCYGELDPCYSWVAAFFWPVFLPASLVILSARRVETKRHEKTAERKKRQAEIDELLKREGIRP